MLQAAPAERRQWRFQRTTSTNTCDRNRI